MFFVSIQQKLQRSIKYKFHASCINLRVNRNNRPKKSKEPKLLCLPNNTLEIFYQKISFVVQL